MWVGRWFDPVGVRASGGGVGGDRAQLLQGLAGLAAAAPARGVAGRTQSTGKTVFIFPGQGSQWAGMGAQLLDASTVFTEQMRRCDKALAEYVPWSLLDVVRGAPAPLVWIGGRRAAGAVGDHGVAGRVVAIGRGGARRGDRAFAG
ncbi:acyl transferase domain protein [Mycobacterium kansasii 824]|nr:acyl transferase domain protein [Mycobacterium kansasii 824]